MVSDHKMNNDAGLVASLVERLTTRLPHLTGGNPNSEPKHDEIASITRASLVKLSTNSIALILNSLVSLLEDVARFYNFASHPQYVRHSEIYIVALAADCCTAHWDAIRKASPNAPTGSAINPSIPPKPIDDNLVKRVLGHIRHLIDPIPDGYVIPTKAMLENDYVREILDPRYEEPARTLTASSGSDSARDAASVRDRVEEVEDIEPYIKVIVEFISAANWSASFDYIRHALHSKRATAPAHVNATQGVTMSDEDRNLLVIIKLLQFLWVDTHKLGLVMQDLSTTFLHFRRPYQNTVALVAPVLIFKWIERFPREFVRLHGQRRRLDGGPDALADMAHSLGDNGRRRSSLYPFQTTLLMLVPEVFEVASNLRDAKGGNMAKRVAFLEGLRKGLRNRNETAGVCLVILVRAARHFASEPETAFSSYVMDIQDELRDAVFRRYQPHGDAILFEQDLTTAALISLIHINMDAYIDPLVQACAQHTAPLSFKVAIVQTCSYFARRDNAQDYRRLYVAVAGFIQNQLKVMSASSADLYVGVRRSRRKASISDARTANEIVICNILKFLVASPLSLFESVSPEAKNSDSFYEEIYKSFVSCLVTANDTVRVLSMPLAQGILPTNGLLASVRQATPLDSNDFKLRFWKLTSSVLLDMCDKFYEHEDVSILRSIQKYLETGLLLLTTCRELCRLAEDFPERTEVAIKVESLLLVALCAPELETCQVVTTTLGLLNEECLILLRESQEANVATLQLPNYDVYAEVASREFRFTGMMAFQKRTRALLRRITFPSPSILDAWERAYDKWNHLSNDLSMTYTAKDDKLFVEWRNLTGFLASLGGICTAEQAYGILEEPLFNVLRWIDRVAAEDSETPILHMYLQRSTALLSSSNGLVRETIRDVLSTEISPTLYLPLFKALEAELGKIFDEARENPDKGQERHIIFAAEAASLLRNLVDKLESSAEFSAAAAVNFSALGLEFVKFLDGAAENPTTLRLKTRFCQLYESVTKKKEHLNFRDDVRKRNLLLEYIFSWIARPRSPRSEGSYMGRRDEEAIEAQKDLDKACFRCLASLTYRLPLQPGEGQCDAGTSELKSQMFHTYFHRFLTLLNHETSENTDRETPTHDESKSTSALAITILSNLLSANIDVGLKHSLNIGYHENIEIRTAFVKVLYNILVQGTEFSTLSDKAINEKYSALIQLLTHDMSLVVAISAACPSSEVEELTVSLLNIFESRGLTFELIEALIKQEIDDTENEAELLRRNCVATKMLSVYAKWKGAHYLRSTLQKVLEKLMLTSQDLDLELDPSRLASQEELEKHAKQLRIVARVFIDDICSSSVNIPPSFRKICSIISAAVMPRFPEARYTAVGAFIFLRFFCPAIVSPESERLVTGTPSKELRRGLLLIAKIIQNLANNVLFGAKEPYMSPLNDFLSQNIYDVTTFLREISVAPETIEMTPSDNESFDFGSCVILHRFLYEQWDNVRRRLIQERKEQIRTPNELTRSRPTGHEPVRTLINTLGPPSLAITWNRPQVSANYFTTYSRFQHFMLRNAYRDSSSYIGNRVIYDGGETKDGISLICIILRNIDQETTDPNTLLFAYLKLVSRQWHKPFGVLIDATCNNLPTDYHDEMMRKLGQLAPAEAVSSQTRLYIYNMNSVYRKTLRRNLRVFKELFEKSSTEIHLLSSSQDLQTHFNLSEIPLPKETLDIAADARHIFQSVTRLSKTKGKIEVTIRVGSQYVQVTTMRKHEVHPNHNLSAILNDIFRLSDIDEAPTSIEDDSAFGLRADNGKIVMYFQSSRKNEILQAIRSAKTKYAKDTRIMKSSERFIRPQDIPGTLLNLALTNLAAPDHVLRIASYNLLGALCQAFKFKAASKFVCITDVHIPLDHNQFIVNISNTLAQEEPQLTADFLNEFFVGWEYFTEAQKPLSLAYMAPWLLGLRTAFLGDDSDAEIGKERIATIFQKLLDATTQDSSLCLALEQTVWPAIYKDETLLDIFLEVIMKTALAFGSSDKHMQTLTSIVIAVGTITLRGRIISRLRKALNRSVVRPTRYLPENVVWDEIVILLQFCLALSFDCGVQSQLYMPEIFHIVTMLSNSGSVEVRSTVQRLLINSLHAASTSFNLDDQKSNKLRTVLEKIADPKNDTLFVPPSLIRDANAATTSHDGSQALVATEQLAVLLFDLCTIAAPTVDLANAWRSRWMSLVASTAFQNNPAIQPRAFTVMGCLAREEIDDDLLYQVLVALRHSITRFGENGSTDMLVAVVTSLSKMIMKLTSASRYALQLFWLAISLIRLMPTPRLFNCATQLLEAVLANISSSNELRSEKTASFLLQGRSTLEEATIPLDDIYGVHFTPDNFHFAVCACLVRGLTDPVTKPTTLRVVSTFLELTTSSLSASTVKMSPNIFYQSPYMTLIQSRLVDPDQVEECLWSANINPSIVANLSLDRSVRHMEHINDKDLLLHIAIQLVDFPGLEGDIQTHNLTWLNNLAVERPAAMVHLYSSITSLLNRVLVHAQKATTLRAAHELLRLVTSNPNFAPARDRQGTLVDILEDMGFEGLWRTSTFLQAPEFDKQLIGFTEKLIELIIM